MPVRLHALHALRADIATLAQIAVATVRATAARLRTLSAVLFCCYSARDQELYQALLGEAE
jgi:hypothetical protein